MANDERSNLSVAEILQQRLSKYKGEYLLPPPVFETMEGEFLSFDLEVGLLRTRFPIKSAYLNPYGTMQGGMIAAAVDNTLGPLSVLVAPPNVTRRLEMKYSRATTPSLGFILVEGVYLGRAGQELSFRAEVRDPQGNLLARAKAWHWVIDG